MNFIFGFLFGATAYLIVSANSARFKKLTMYLVRYNPQFIILWMWKTEYTNMKKLRMINDDFNAMHERGRKFAVNQKKYDATHTSPVEKALYQCEDEVSYFYSLLKGAYLAKAVEHILLQE